MKPSLCLSTSLLLPLVLNGVASAAQGPGAGAVQKGAVQKTVEAAPAPDLEGAVPAGLHVLLKPEDMRTDLATWKDGLERLCAGLYRYVGKEDLDRAFDELEARLTGEMTLLDYLRELMKINAMLRRAQCYVGLPSEMTSRDFGKASAVPPVEVALQGERLFVTGTLGDSPGLPLGSEILEINGLTVPAMLQRLTPALLCEGYNESAKAWKLHLTFPLYYVLFIDDTRAEYHFLYVDPNGHRQEVTLAGVPGKSAFDAANPNAGKELLEFHVLDGLDAAVLAIRSLHARELSSSAYEWETFLDESFGTLAAKKIGHLVLDLRGNQHGSDAYGVELVSHLVSEPFRYIHLVEVAPEYNGNQDTARRKDGTPVLFPYVGMGPQDPAPDPFTGELIVLIDGGTYGTAADVASVLHRMKRATFVGQETGGVCDGSSGGTSENVRLEKSGLYADVPTMNYLLEVDDHDRDGLGVPPDHVVEPAVEDLIRGDDTVMRFVRERLLER
jgi:Peptidase family S41